MTECLETAYFIPNDELSEKPAWVAFLIVLQGSSVGNRFLLNKNEISIGRAKDVDICLAEDEGVSRMHAVIQRSEDAEKFVLIDKNSINGILINSKKIKTITLKDQDLISISDHVLKFISSTSPEQEYYNELYQKNHIDKVLQVYDKYYFLTKLDEEIKRCQRYDTELSLILFDVDFFKQTNDRYGHLAGDAVLVQLCEVAKHRIRDTDILCRYGGEEFAIIMPQTDAQQAYILAEHIRTLVAKKPVNYGNTLINTTISLGLSSTNAIQSITSQALIFQADKAMYQAKRAGRNKTILFNQNL